MRKITILAASLLPWSALAFTTTDSTTAPSAVGISSVADFYDMIVIAAKWIVVFGIIIGAVFIIWGGIKYATAGGDEGTIGDAKKMIIGGLIGIALVLLAYALINILGSFFGAGPIVSG
jgi:hypothetical protein